MSEKIKILLINTSDSVGGAAVASNRLLRALNKQAEVEAKLLVKDKQSGSDKIVTIQAKFRYLFSFLWERLVIWLACGLKRSKIFQIDIANAGVDVTRERAFQEADIIHLHWVNQGMLSLRQIGRIITSGKPIVWTLHDMWPITGVCHHARSCDQYESYCMNCPYLAFRKLPRDLSYHVFHRKRKLYLPYALTFVGCSQWIANEAKKSALTKNQQVFSIPNVISINTYKPKNKSLCRKYLNLPQDKTLILFGSVNVSDKRKGFEPFIEACEKLRLSGYTSDNLGIVVVGNNTEKLEDLSPFTVYSMGFVTETEKKVDIYNAVDLYITSSLEENLPNMIMEAMSCGTPCVGFNVGGIPEMIDHLENGYVASFGDVSDLVDGVQWVLKNSTYYSLSETAREKVLNSYSEEVVTPKYIQLYQSLLKGNGK